MRCGPSSGQAQLLRSSSGQKPSAMSSANGLIKGLKAASLSFPVLPSNNSKLHLDYLDYLDLISTQGSFPASCISTHVRSRVSKKAAPFHTDGALMWILGRSWAAPW